jgi:hypothetical protein
VPAQAFFALLHREILETGNIRKTVAVGAPGWLSGCMLFKVAPISADVFYL